MGVDIGNVGNIVAVLFQPKGCPVTSVDTDAFLLNSALLTVKSIVVSAVAVPPVPKSAFGVISRLMMLP